MAMTFALTFLIIGFAYLGFGLFILRFFKFKFTSLEKILFSLILSISILSMSFVLLAKELSIKSYYLLVPAFLLGAITLWWGRNIFTELLVKIKKHFVPSLFLLFAIIALISGLIFSGIYKNNYLVLKNTHGSSWHVSLIEESLRNLPPHHPSNPKIILNNYHYFYDVFLASLGFFSNLSAINLHYQIGQIMMATLLVVSAFCFGRRIHSRKAGLLLVFFVTFVGSFAYFIPFFLPNQSWSESSFWVSQTFATMTNPQLIFSFATFFSLLILYTQDFFKLRKRHYLIIALIIPSIGFKSYGWILMSLLYAMDLLISFWRKKESRYIIYGLIYLLLSLPIIYLITGFKTNNFFYHPLWFIDTMVEAPDRLNHLNWRFLLDHYQMTGNVLRIIFLRTIEIIIFYIGNLGIRVVILLFPIWRLIKRKTWEKEQPLADLLFILFLFSSIFPLIFLQRGTVWNSIQFWYYSLIFANVLAVLVYLKLSKNWKKWQKLFALVLLVCLSIPTFWQSTNVRWRSFAQVPELEVKLLTNLEPDKKILICPDDGIWYKNSIVSALSPAEVYLADSGQVSLLNISIEDFEKFEEIFNEQNLSKLTQLSQVENIDYILCANQNNSDFVRKLNWQEQQFNDWWFFSAKNSPK